MLAVDARLTAVGEASRRHDDQIVLTKPVPRTSRGSCEGISDSRHGTNASRKV